MAARPALAVYVARIAVGWSRAEECLGQVVVQLLGIHAHAGMKMYSALSGSASRKSVILALVRDYPREIQTELESALALFKEAAGKRNKIIHGQWSICEDRPDDLVWQDPGAAMLSYSEFSSGWNAFADDDTDKYQWARTFKGGRDRRYILYGVEEFEAILEDIRRVTFAFLNLNLSVEKTRKIKLARPEAA